MVISDPEAGKSYQVEVKEPEARKLVGLRIGDKVDGAALALAGYELQITGGTDKDGFPMRPDIGGSGRTSVLLSGGLGFRAKEKGERRRRRIRGSQISESIVQVNTRVVKKGEKPLQEIFPPKEKAEKKA
ncbi:MAG: 30S ribosomal protein S6e [Candidatus Hadarchaeota archaeon]